MNSQVSQALSRRRRRRPLNHHRRPPLNRSRRLSGKKKKKKNLRIRRPLNPAAAPPPPPTPTIRRPLNPAAAMPFNTDYKPPSGFVWPTDTAVLSLMRKLIERFDSMAGRANSYEDAKYNLDKFYAAEAKSLACSDSPLKEILEKALKSLRAGRDDVIDTMMEIYGLGSRPLYPVENLDHFVAQAIGLPTCLDAFLEHMEPSAREEEKAFLAAAKEARRVANEEAKAARRRESEEESLLLLKEKREAARLRNAAMWDSLGRMAKQSMDEMAKQDRTENQGRMVAARRAEQVGDPAVFRMAEQGRTENQGRMAAARRAEQAVRRAEQVGDPAVFRAQLSRPSRRAQASQPSRRRQVSQPACRGQVSRPTQRCHRLAEERAARLVEMRWLMSTILDMSLQLHKLQCEEELYLQEETGAPNRRRSI